MLIMRGLNESGWVLPSVLPLVQYFYCVSFLDCIEVGMVVPGMVVPGMVVPGMTGV
jgi:hypothetical protein